ncbi:CaiB/BaiF CoA-transferase family protein [Clostridium oceanicum]|uniref:Isocaprenoyl-CoA:2-hydroxyisocaproate CoA-transferase HadA n=1 Tax=Clostridium oceanicum TaxID=1543 RepID=A0ABP3UJC1_9CLOT
MKDNEKLLEGVKVVELATFIAAPSCTKALADWGADVVKVEAPFGDSARYAGANFKMPILEEENPLFETVNSNKRSVSINLKSEEGKKVFFKLLDKADVLVTNMRTKALKKLGLCYEQLCEKYPNIIFAQILGYGEKGPDKDKPGFDYTAYYARSGIMGTLMEKDTSPINPAAGFGDHQAGMYLASGVCAALYKKLRTGKGEKVTVSLFHTGVYGMSLMIASSKYGNNWPVSRKAPNSPCLNCYKCKDDKWIQIAIIEYDKYISKLSKMIERPDIADNEKFNTSKAVKNNIAELVSILEEQFKKKTLSEWKEIFTKGDIPFEKVQVWEDVAEDEQAWANDYLYKIQYENGNSGVLVNTPVKFKKMGLPEFNRAPKLGENTEEVLKDLGISNENIKNMKEKKVIK